MTDLPSIGPAETVNPATSQPNATVVNDYQPFTARPYGPLLGFLDIGKSELTNKAQAELQELWDYLGKVTNSETTSERLHALRLMESRLSPPRIGQSRFEKLYNYVRAQQEVERAEDWRNNLMKGTDEYEPQRG